MKILLLGATGRVGNAILTKAIGQGHVITAFVRNRNKITNQNPNLHLVEGDIHDADALAKLTLVDFDILINVIGADPLKPSTIFTDATKLAIALLTQKTGKRYIAITGIAQMPQSLLGKIAIAILKLTPVKNAIIDHQHAYDQLKDTTIDWLLVGCPYIKDGPEKGFFKKGDTFTGGFKTIHPGDVATAIVQQITNMDHRKITGIWY